MKKTLDQKLRKRRLGPLGQKIILLLAAGISLSLTQRPDRYFRILNKAAKEWQKINERSLHESIKKLYQSKIVGYKERSDGTVALILDDDGKKRVLEYNLEKMEVKKPKSWDGMWRIVIFDIPEHKKKARDALAVKMKMLGLLPIQRSVFIHPYNCKDEVEFIAELFEVKPYVRFIVAKEIDIALELKHKFDLL